MNARIFKGKLPDPAARRSHNKLPPVPLYFVRCDCGYASEHLTKAGADDSLAAHAAREATYA